MIFALFLLLTVVSAYASHFLCSMFFVRVLTPNSDGTAIGDTHTDNRNKWLTALKKYFPWKRIVTYVIISVAMSMVLNGEITFFSDFTLYKFFVGVALLGVLLVSDILYSLSKLLKGYKSLPALMLLALVLAMSFEGVFNFRAIQSHEYEPFDLLPYVTSSTVSANGGVYKTKSQSLTIECKEGFKLNLKNVHITAEAFDKKGEEKPVDVTLYANDKGNKKDYQLGVRRIYGSDKLSQYIPLNTSGESEEFSIIARWTNTNEGEMTISGITANVARPFVVRPSRIIFVFMMLAVGFIIRPSSFLYEVPLFGGSKKKRIAVVTVAILINVVLATIIIFSNTAPMGYFSSHQKQYAELAQQLLKGKITYSKEVPDALKALANPYDPSQRKGIIYSWDTAYFNGNYYVYFGVVPVLLLYVPFRFITHTDLTNDRAMAMILPIFIIAAFFLIYEIMKKYFPKVPFLTYLVMSLIVANGSGLFMLIVYPSLYCVPIFMGMTLTALGLALWFSALQRETLSPWKLALGSLCMALVAGCRPQMLLVSFVAIPLFWDAVFKKKTLLPTTSRGAANFCSFVLPYVAVAAGIMCYNNARFGSPFDFGANYNLTTNDMTVRGFRFDRIGISIWQYLIQLPTYISKFPFIKSADVDTSYMGVVIWERTYGGLFAIAPFTLFSLLAFHFKDKLQKNKLFYPSVLLLAAGVIIAVADGQMAGLLLRYFGDFALPIFISAVFVFMTLLSSCSDKARKLMSLLLCVCFAITIIFGAALIFKSSSEYLKFKPDLITIVQFW